MNFWIIIKDGVISTNGYVSLKDACKSAGVSYYYALKGCRVFKKHSVEIVKCKVIKSKSKLRLK